MTDCSCLSQKIEFDVYEDRKLKWHEWLIVGYDPRIVKSTIITIHGDSMDEIDKKCEEFKKDYIKGMENPVRVSYYILR